DVSGRPQVLLMLERLIAHVNGHEGVRWATFDEIADDFLARTPRSWAVFARTQAATSSTACTPGVPRSAAPTDCCTSARQPSDAGSAARGHGARRAPGG